MSMTQIEAARAGTITPEMEIVAADEHLDAEFVRQEVAAGRMVIPANRVHLAGQTAADGQSALRLAAKSTPILAIRP